MAPQAIIDHVHEVHGAADWGLDHGTWTVLHHLYPKADIPVLQRSLDYTKPLAWHFSFARQLRFLRERGCCSSAAAISSTTRA